MNITEHIAQHIIEVHEGNNWTEVNVKDTLQDVVMLEAVTRTIASANTIAALLHHLTFWNRVMVERVKGVAVAIPDSNGFGVPVIRGEEDWNRLKEGNIASAHELAAAVRSFPEHQLESSILPGHSSAYKNLQGTAEHIHYHLGQIVGLKHLIRAGV